MNLELFANANGQTVLRDAVTHEVVENLVVTQASFTQGRDTAMNVVMFQPIQVAEPASRPDSFSQVPDVNHFRGERHEVRFPRVELLPSGSVEIRAGGSIHLQAGARVDAGVENASGITWTDSDEDVVSIPPPTPGGQMMADVVTQTARQRACRTNSGSACQSP